MANSSLRKLLGLEVPSYGPKKSSEAKDQPRQCNLRPLKMDQLCRGFQLRPTSYKQEELSDIITYFLRPERTVLNKRQYSAIDRFYKNSRKISCNTWEFHLRLYSFISIFDDLFFNGWLEKYSKVTLTFYCEHNYPAQARVHYRQVEQTWIPDIDIAFRADGFQTDPEAQRALLSNHLNALLHEMIHGFFSMYCCVCNDCGEELYGSKNRGYWIPFQEMAFAIEKAGSDMLPWTLNLNREGDMIDGLVQMREDYEPPAWEFKRVGLSKERIMEAVYKAKIERSDCR